jgi:putative tricarboxylic transport membrane protein
MHFHRVRMALPYAVLLALAAWFYRLAGEIQYTHQGSNLGPDFWPRMALAAMMIICALQGVRLLIFGQINDDSIIAKLEDVEPEEEAPPSRLLLAAGTLLTIAYGLSLTTLGFLTASFLFMVLFMYAGRYRAHLTIWLSSLVAAVLLTLLFQKVVYVSLPRGTAPFDRITDFVLGLF